MLVRMWMSKDLATVTAQTPAAEALKLMNERKIRRLPVLSNNELVGIVVKSDLVRVQQAPTMLVSEVMSKNPATVGPETPIEEAGMVMRDRRIGALPVVDQKKLVGMITETDVFRALIEVLGLKTDGTRLAIEMDSKPETFYRLMQLIGESGRKMLSVVLYHSYGKDKSMAVLRVEGTEHETLSKKLWDSKYRVVKVS